MTDDYLWDKRNRPVDPFVAELERALASKRYAPRPAPLAAAGAGAAGGGEERLTWPAMALGSLLALAAAAILWFALWTAPTAGEIDASRPNEGPVADGAGMAEQDTWPESEVDIEPVVRRSGDPVTK